MKIQNKKVGRGMTKLNITWAQLRDTDVRLHDGRVKTIGEVLLDCLDLQVPDGRCKVNVFDLYKCNYLLSQCGVVDRVCDYTLSWNDYADAYEGAIISYLKANNLKFARVTQPQDKGVLVTYKNPFDFKVLSEGVGFVQIFPLYGFWGDIYNMFVEDNQYDITILEAPFLRSKKWVVEFLVEWVYLFFQTVLLWELKNYALREIVQLEHSDLSDIQLQKHMKKAEGELKALTEKVESSLAGVELNFTDCFNLEGVCDYLQEHRDLGCYRVINHIIPKGQGGLCTFIATFLREDYSYEVLEFSVLFSLNDIYNILASERILDKIEEKVGF